MKPCAQPKSASSRTSPTMIQSTPVTRPSVPGADRARFRPGCRTLPQRTTRPSQCAASMATPTRSAPDPRPSGAPPPPGRRRRMASRLAPLVLAARGRVRGRDRGRRRQREPAPGRRPAVRATPGARRLRGHVRAADAGGAAARPAGALRRRLPRRRQDEHARPRGRREGGRARRRRVDRAGARCGRGSSARCAGSSPLPVVEQDDGAAIAWQRNLVHPGLRRGEQLSRRTELPPRAAILARDGTPLAEGENAAVRPRRRSRRRSPDASARRRPSAPPSSSAAACPTAPRSA